MVEGSSLSDTKKEIAKNAAITRAKRRDAASGQRGMFGS
jgi:hypothetical protein